MPTYRAEFKRSAILCCGSNLSLFLGVVMYDNEFEKMENKI